MAFSRIRQPKSELSLAPAARLEELLFRLRSTSSSEPSRQLSSTTLRTKHRSLRQLHLSNQSEQGHSRTSVVVIQPESVLGHRRGIILGVGTGQSLLAVDLLCRFVCQGRDDNHCQTRSHLQSCTFISFSFPTDSLSPELSPVIAIRFDYTSFSNGKKKNLDFASVASRK